MKQTDYRYWIAINGPSCTMSSFPMMNPTIHPTPDQAIGFLTVEEARAAQHLCLTAPMDKVRKFFADLTPRVNSGEIRVIQPENPQPPTQNTVWLDAPLNPQRN